MVNDWSSHMPKMIPTSNQNIFICVAAINTTRYSYSMPNILLLGDTKVGKTSLMYRICADTFSESYAMTIAKDYMAFNNHIIHDTSGADRFQQIAQVYYPYADGAIIVFDVTNKESFRRVTHWEQVLLQKLRQHIPILIIGNKIDLENTHTRQRNIMYVSCKEGDIDLHSFLDKLTTHKIPYAYMLDSEDVCPCCAF